MTRSMTIMYSSKSSDSSFLRSLALNTEAGGQCESWAGLTAGHPTCKRTWAYGLPQADTCGITASRATVPTSPQSCYSLCLSPSHTCSHIQSYNCRFTWLHTQPCAQFSHLQLIIYAKTATHIQCHHLTQSWPLTAHTHTHQSPTTTA